MTFEFRSDLVTMTEDSWGQPDKIEKTCNEWATEGWEVFSVICPNPRNYLTYRLTARRQVKNSSYDGRKFR